MKKIKRGLINVLLLLLAACMLFTGCKPAPAPDNGDTTLNDGGEGNGGNNDVGNQNTGGNENGGATNESQGLENGLMGGGGKPSLLYLPRGAYKSDKTEFELDDVTLEFYYGIRLDDMHSIKLHVGDIPKFELCFLNEDGDRITVRKVKENFISEKYKLDLTWNLEIRKFNVKYNYSESITIPKEIFTRECGIITFVIVGDSIFDEKVIPDYCLVKLNIFYKKIDERIKLASHPSALE